MRRLNHNAPSFVQGLRVATGHGPDVREIADLCRIIRQTTPDKAAWDVLFSVNSDINRRLGLLPGIATQDSDVAVQVFTSLVDVIEKRKGVPMRTDIDGGRMYAVREAFLTIQDKLGRDAWFKLTICWPGLLDLRDATNSIKWRARYKSLQKYFEGQTPQVHSSIEASLRKVERKWDYLTGNEDYDTRVKLYHLPDLPNDLLKELFIELKLLEPKEKHFSPWHMRLLREAFQKVAQEFDEPARDEIGQMLTQPRIFMGAA